MKDFVLLAAMFLVFLAGMWFVDGCERLRRQQ